ncbi:extracellular solute-binding protein [Paenibacillus koleovorans]|uniref:extracellular solute-binding protein n=1 Tax=Paenibacillus koleovorans TaxID=121608 RepID=UPI000FD9D94A|nr:extracellular solute-binding protein [Paenibacillus koleovorans]
MKALKVLSTVLVVSVVATSAVACTSKEDPAPAATGSSSASPTGSAKPAREKLDLKWFVGSSAMANANLPSADKDFVRKVIEEKFNVSLKIDYMNFSADYTSKMNVILTSGDYPDMFIAQGTDSQKYATDGLLADQSTFVTPQTMPNYFKYWITQDEINNYQLKGIKHSRSPVPFQRNTYASFFIRKDWLDKLGLQMPKSYEELLAAMKAFTEKDPDGNGKKDTYGMSAAAGGGRIPFDFPQWIQNGLVADFRVEGNTFIESQTDPKVQNVIQGIVDMMKDGIVDPDWYVNKAPQHMDKAAQGKVGVMWSGDPSFGYDTVSNSVQARTKALDPKADWQPIFPFANAPYGWKAGTPGGTGPFVFAKSVAEKSPEKIKRSVEILDWLAGEEGYILTHYGQEGKHYKREGNKITIDPDAIDKDIVKQGDWLNVWRFFTTLDEPAVLKLDVVDPRLSDRDRAIKKFVEAIPKHKGEPVTLAPPEGTNIGDFRKEMSRLQAQAIFEDKTGSVWPKYREELMTKYSGGKIFQGYVDQINVVLPADKKLQPWK